MALILIIDDDPSILRSVTETLEQEGHEVRGAENGKSALELVADSLPDLIISDVYMPEMDGIELLNQLQTEHPATPLVAMSGGGSMAKEELLRDSSMLGAVAVLEKPFTIELLLDVVNRALEGGVMDEPD